MPSEFCVDIYIQNCTCCGVQARKIPGQFNETRYILICTCTTVILWMAFVPMMFVTNEIRIRLFSLTASQALNATVTLLCMFGPKLYIVLCRPHKNTKDVSSMTD